MKTEKNKKDFKSEFGMMLALLKSDLSVLAAEVL